MERDKRAKLASFRKEAGMSEENREKMQGFLGMQTDWYVFCKNCNEKIIGTIDKVKDHGKSCKRETTITADSIENN